MHTEQEIIGPLKIVVCIKQVPLLSGLRFDPETRRLVREGMPLDLNELDVSALTEAVRLHSLYGGEVIAITMGPPQVRGVPEKFFFSFAACGGQSKNVNPKKAIAHLFTRIASFSSST